MSQWISSAEHRVLVLAKCVLRDVPEALTPSMVRALVQAGVDLPAEIRKKFPDLGENQSTGPVRSPTNDP